MNKSWLLPERGLTIYLVNLVTRVAMFAIARIRKRKAIPRTQPQTCDAKISFVLVAVKGQIIAYLRLSVVRGLIDSIEF